jgi:hypothetical protein
MDHGSGQQHLGEPLDCSRADAFTLQEDGKLRCPAGASLRLSEVRQENAFTRACRLVFPTRPIVSVVLFGRSVWRKAQKVIVRAGSVLFVVFCPHLPRLSVSESLFHSDRYDGWTWQAERFVAPGPLIGTVNTPRSSRLLNTLRGVSLHHVPLVRCVRITAGVGPIGSHATPGGDHRNCVLLSRAFPLFLFSTNPGGIS